MIFRAAPKEGVAQRQYYPEPWWITNRWWCWMLYRGLLGRPMDGVRWTNSSFWRSATEGEASWWLRLAGWQRSLIRVCSLWFMLTLTALTGAWFLLDAQRWVLQVLLAHVVVSAPLLLLIDAWFRKEHGLRLPLMVEELEQTELSEQQELELKGEVPTRRSLRMVVVREGRRTWEEELVRPVAAVAAEILDLAWHPGEARQWVSIPRDYMQPGGGAVEIMLPKKFSASEAKKKQLLAAVKPRLGMLELRDEWMLRGRHPKLLLSAPPAPPEKAPFSQYRDLILAVSAPYRPVLGVVAGGELLSAEMVSDSPHIALSAGSGAGKSRMGGMIAAQAGSWGWALMILDWKEESYEWARGLPGVRYYSTPQAIHDACIAIGEEVEARKALPKEEREKLPRILVVREEWNMTAAILADYWAGLRATADPEERRTMPLRSPALSAIMMLDFAGRSFGMFDLLKAQRMSNRVFNGNTDIRENFMIRLMARYTVQTWKMLLPHLKFMPKPKQLGGWIVAAGDEATLVQGILATDEELRELYLSGQPNPASPFAVRGGTQHGVANVRGSNTLGDQLSLDAAGHSVYRHPVVDAEVVELPPAPMKKLRDIADDLDYLGITYDILRNASRGDDKGDPTFPAVVGGNQFKGYLYDVRQVTQWAQQKRAAEAAERVRR